MERCGFSHKEKARGFCLVFIATSDNNAIILVGKLELYLSRWVKYRQIALGNSVFF
jgi:hypothetical protein